MVAVYFDGFLRSLGQVARCCCGWTLPLSTRQLDSVFSDVLLVFLDLTHNVNLRLHSTITN